MNIVQIINGDIVTEIHGEKEKLLSGTVTQGINAIDSFTFTMLPDNAGFSLINEFTTHVEVYNTSKDKSEFVGRVLYAETTMDDKGLISKTVTCESILGYLCDSYQFITETQNWTVSGLLKHMIDTHNEQIEDYKKIKIGTVTAQDKNDNLYLGLQDETTWAAIKAKLIDKIGGEIRLRVENDGLYLDYLEQLGSVKETEIALSSNMKSITKEQDPTSFITRLSPLGCKLKDEEGNEMELRLDISSVNGGSYYIDDEEAIRRYGIHVGVMIFDDITEAQNLYNKGVKALAENNRVQVKYSITALDLFLLGIAMDDLSVGNYHPIKNSLIGVDDIARIIKKKIDVCNETSSTIEIGDNFKSLSDIQRDQTEQIKAAQQTVNNLEKTSHNQYAGFLKELNTMKNAVNKLDEDFTTEIQQLSDGIKLEVDGSLGSNASIILSVGTNKYSGEFDLSQIRQAFADDNTAISISAGLLTFNAGTIVINSSKFTLDSSGKIEATDAVIYGDIITIDGSYKTEMDKGSLRLYYDDILCGTINTKYWSGASTEGISLRVEEGGNYIMFSHADDTQGSGYVVDYYLNAGWSSNYDEMHIFQTSARFLSDAYFAGYTRIRSLRLFGADGEYLVGIGSNGGLSVSKL